MWSRKGRLWGSDFGVSRLRATNDNGGYVDCLIRFQGQIEDTETGLYYNRHRYYDPSSGDYLTPDPIGIEGGLRSFGYVPDPTSLIDPLGLAVCQTRYNNYKFLREQGFSAADAAKYSKGAGNLHAPQRHGPSVSNGQLIDRANTGRLPDTGQIPNYIRNGRPPPDATAFSSWKNYRNSYDAVHQNIPAGGGTVVVDMGSPMGQGAVSGSSTIISSSNTVTGIFNNTGQLITLFPNL